MTRVHATAVVSEGVELARDVEVGPYCVLEAGVRVGDGTVFRSHVIARAGVTIGARNVVHPFAVLGGEPQTRAREQGGALVIGDENVIREHVTVNLSTGAEPTRIGSGNLLMAGAHVAHDVHLGSRCVLANGVMLAGHCVVADWVTFGGLAGVAQRVRVAESAFVAAGAMCERWVPPFVIVQGDRARVRALNVVGLERRGVPPASVAALKVAFRKLFVGRCGSLTSALLDIDRTDPFVEALASFLSAAE